MEIYIIKIIGLIIIILVTLVFGILPLKLKKFRSNKTLISFSNCFTAGLFIALGLLHILPEAHEQIQNYFDKDKNEKDNLSNFNLENTNHKNELLLEKEINLEIKDSHEENEHNLEKEKNIKSEKENYNLINENHHSEENNNLEKNYNLKQKNINLQENHSSDEENYHSKKEKENFEKKNKNLKDENHSEHNDLHSEEDHGGHNHNNFPLAFILCVTTYSLILFIDKVLFNNKEIIEKKDKEIHDDRSELPFNENSKLILSSKYKIFLKNQKPEDFDKNMHISHFNKNAHDESLVVKNYENPNKKEELNILETSNNDLILSKEELNFQNFTNIKKKSYSEENKNLITKTKNANHNHHPSIKKTDSIISSYILLLAISLHGFFEGMAFGVSTKKSETINILIAILLHKWSESLIISISLIKAKISFKRSFFLMIIFTFVAPLVIGIIKALSVGTFIYLACTEILVEEFVDCRYKYWKFLFYLLGIGFILVISLLE